MPPSDNLQKTKRYWDLNKELLSPESVLMFALFAFNKIKVGFNGFKKNAIKLTVNKTKWTSWKGGGGGGGGGGCQISLAFACSFVR